MTDEEIPPNDSRIIRYIVVEALKIYNRIRGRVDLLHTLDRSEFDIVYYAKNGPALLAYVKLRSHTKTIVQVEHNLDSNQSYGGVFESVIGVPFPIPPIDEPSYVVETHEGHTIPYPPPIPNPLDNSNTEY